MRGELTTVAIGVVVVAAAQLLAACTQPEPSASISTGKEVFDLLFGRRQALLMRQLDGRLKELAIRLNSIRERIAPEQLARLGQVLGPKDQTRRETFR